MINLGGKTKSDQSGLASLVIVSTLVIILSLISVGFSRLMDRSLSRSVDTQLSTAAQYAAESGVNDAIALLKKHKGNISSTKCTDLFDQQTDDLYSKVNLSSDANNARYTCILISQDAGDSIGYSDIPAFRSKVVPIDTQPFSNRLMISWEDSIPPGGNLPAQNSKTLFDETTWSSGTYGASVLRVTLYPIGAGGSLTSTQDNSRTYFFYPTSGTTAVITNYNNKNVVLIPTNCNADTTPIFNGDSRLKCKAVIDNMDAVNPIPSYYYARITPLYKSAKVQINGNSASGAKSSFENAQKTIDVTAKVGNVYKRLQVRVSVKRADVKPVFDDIPEYAIRSAKTICKALTVDDSAGYWKGKIDDNNCKLRFACGQGPWDPSCFGPPPCVTDCTTDPNAICNDGQDNDGDTRYDWDGNGRPEGPDKGCSSPGDMDESDGSEPCDGGGCYEAKEIDACVDALDPTQPFAGWGRCADNHPNLFNPACAWRNPDNNPPGKPADETVTKRGSYC